MCQDNTNIVHSNTDNDIINYESSELILNICMDEYSNERERSERFDNKAGLFLTALIALLAIYIQMIPFEKIKSNYEASYRIAEMTVFMCILFLAIVFFIISFSLFIISLLSREYKKVDIDDLEKSEINSQKLDNMAFALNKHYVKIINHNKTVNDKKLKYCQNGIILTLISFLLLLTSIIGIFIII